MTQEEKDLLLKDLCSRLPYGVKIAMPGLWDSKIIIEPLNEIFKGDDGLFRANGNGHCIEYIKPYLFPLSSMTDEQRKEYEDALVYHDYVNGGWTMAKTFDDEYVVPYWFVDFCNKHHFDYRGLITMDLALDATNLNIY